MSRRVRSDGPLEPSTAVCAWDQPTAALAPGVWCGTSLCLPPNTVSNSVYGPFNLALHVGDDPSAVEQNRLQLQGSLQVGPMQWLDQVHGCEVIEASAASLALVPTADAVWTQVSGLPIAVLTADCLPVVVAAHDGSCIGVAHGGWRGLVGGVLPALVDAMPVPAAELNAWGGPGIGVAAYEVGAEVASAVSVLPGAEVALTSGASQDKFLLDLHRLAEVSLAAAGVSNYQATNRCAFQDTACYSYRRQQGRATGRMATVGILL